LKILNIKYYGREKNIWKGEILNIKYYGREKNIWKGGRNSTLI